MKVLQECSSIIWQECSIFNTMFFSICLGKRSAKAIEFLGILKKYFSKNISIFVKKKRNVCLIKKKIFIFYMIFKLSWYRSFAILSTDVCFHFSYFCSSLILVSKTQGIERILTLLSQYKWQKFNKMNEKINLGHQSVSMEYVLGKLIVLFCSFFWDNFTVWFSLHLRNLNMLLSDKMFSQQPQKVL